MDMNNIDMLKAAIAHMMDSSIGTVGPNRPDLEDKYVAIIVDAFQVSPEMAKLMRDVTLDAFERDLPNTYA